MYARMRKLASVLFVLSVSAVMSAQEGGKSFISVLAQKNILNHMDVGVNVGTMGIGVDVAVPVGNYLRVRAGYHYMPRFTINSDFPVETRSGNGSVTDFVGEETNVSDLQGRISRIERRLDNMGVDLNTPEYSKTKALLDYYNAMSPEERKNTVVSDKVAMGLRPSMHQFKLLVDVMPFRNNKHWSFTTGIFVGPSVVGDACNMDKETLALMTISAYNELYVLSCQGNLNGYHISSLEERGVAGFNLGRFKDGNLAIMVPDKDNKARAEMEVSKVRPYIGFGYNTHLSHNKRWQLNVDAGVMFLCGAPKVYVDNVYSINEDNIDFDKYGDIDLCENFDIIHPNENYDYSVPEDPVTNPMYIVDTPLSHVDLIRDVKGIPGKVGDLVDVVSKFKVYPNATVTFSYRLY